MALVLSCTVAKLCHPAFRASVRRATVHQAVDHQDADDGVGVTVHGLQEVQDGDQCVWYVQSIMKMLQFYDDFILVA